MWDEAKLRFPTGCRVRGTVTAHRHFGIFVDLGDPVAVGLVQITEFSDEGRMSPDQYPPIGALVEAIVLGHRDEQGRQVWLGMKPGQLRREA